jgi:hypothetical protein
MGIAVIYPQMRPILTANPKEPNNLTKLVIKVA